MEKEETEQQLIQCEFMAVLLSDEELEKLKGLPFIQSCLYMFGIRPYMDYKTGITGIKRKISYQSLSEEIYIEPIKGVKETGAKSREQIRRAVKSLERAGVITILTNPKNLILKCNLALRDDSVQNKADTKPTPHFTTQADTVDKQENHCKNSMVHTTTEHKADTKADIPEIAKADTPPISVGSDKIRSDPPVDIIPVDNIFSPDSPAHLIYKLLTRRGYYINHMHHKKTLAMINAFVKAGVTPEEAEIGFNHCDRQPNGKPSVPWYYQDAVFQYKADLAAAIKKSEDITHETNRPRATSDVKADSRRDRYKKILR